MADFNKPMSVIITGAGRGYGKPLCLTIARSLQPGSILLLLGRSKEPLEVTKSLVSEINSGVTTYVYENYDCNNFSEAALISYLGDLTPKVSVAAKSLLIIHNAGTVGDPSQKSLDYDLAATNEYMVTNFSSMVALNSVLVKALDNFREQTTVVNISSLLAVLPLKTLGLYCAGKAARDMYFKVVAAENPSMRVLNYAPGPMDTYIPQTVINECFDPEIKTSFQNTTYVKMEDSAERLMTLLKDNKFESGAHVDVFDPLPE